MINWSSLAILSDFLDDFEESWASDKVLFAIQHIKSRNKTCRCENWLIHDGDLMTFIAKLEWLKVGVDFSWKISRSTGWRAIAERVEAMIQVEAIVWVCYTFD